MIDKDAYAIVCETLSPESFYEPRNQRVYQAVMELSMRERPVDIWTVTEQLAHQGDPVALKTWATVGDQLGLAMANAVTFSAPEAIFLMGGPAQVGEPLLKPLREAFDKYLLNIFQGSCTIRMSELKANEVAILGAAALIKMK